MDEASAVPQPPWERGRKRAKREPLTVQRIVDTALEVLDRDGLDGLSMRKVAAELGVAVSALYVHVQDKDELLQLIYERVHEGMRFPDPDPERWQDQLKEIAWEFRRRLHQHRDMGRISMGKSLAGAAVLDQIEHLLAVCAAGGLPPRIAVKAGDFLSVIVEGVVTEEDMWAEQARDQETTNEDFAGEMRKYFGSLPRDRFPLIVDHAQELGEESQDNRFDLFLDVFIRGLETYAED